MKQSLKLKNISIILIILLFGVSPFLLAEADNNSAVNENNSPEYQITRPTAIIKVNPLNYFSNWQNQKNMKVSWHNNQNSGQDLEFILNNDLVLNKSNSSNDRVHGFVSINNNSKNIIPADKILISINGGKYQSFNKGIKVLDKNRISSELKFKIDEDWLSSKWTFISPGVYNADIDVSFNRRGNKPKIQVIIQSAAVINLPENKLIDLIIEDPTKNKSSNSVSWQVSGNGDSYQVQFKSKGIKPSNESSDDRCSIDFQPYFRYSFGDGPVNSFAPGESKTVNIREGELRLNYSPGEYKEGRNAWYKLLAGEYQDQVTITISSD